MMPSYPDNRTVDSLTVDQLKNRIKLLETGSETARAQAAEFLRQNHYFGQESAGPVMVTAIALLIDGIRENRDPL